MHKADVTDEKANLGFS